MLPCNSNSSISPHVCFYSTHIETKYVENSHENSAGAHLHSPPAECRPRIPCWGNALTLQNIQNFSLASMTLQGIAAEPLTMKKVYVFAHLTCIVVSTTFVVDVPYFVSRRIAPSPTGIRNSCNEFHFAYNETLISSFDSIYTITHTIYLRE